MFKKCSIHAIITLVIVIGLTLCAFGTSLGILEVSIDKDISDWLQTSRVITTFDFNEEQQQDVYRVLSEFADEHTMCVVVKNNDRAPGYGLLYHFGVLSSPQAEITPLKILGSPILESSDIAELNEYPDKYLGYGTSSQDQLKSLPSIKQVAAFRVDNLLNLKTWGQKLYVWGLSDTEFNALTSEIAQALNITQENLTSRESGSVIMPNLMSEFAAGAFVLLSLILIVIECLAGLSKLKQLGVYCMLGWSKRDVVDHLFGSILYQLLLVFPLTVLWAYLSYSDFALTSTLVSFVFLTALPTVLVGLIAYGFSVLNFMSVSPINAIRNRYNKRGLYVLSFVVYLVCIAAVISGAFAIDGPIKMYSDLLINQQNWKQVQTDYVLDGFFLKDDELTRDPMFLAPNVYTWYKQHENDPGIYLTHGSYYSEDTLHAFKDFETKPFWVLKASPSYLKSQGIDLSLEELKKASEGVRLYLVSDEIPLTERLQKTLIPNPDIQSSIQTAYMANPRNEFKVAKFEKPLFCWSTDPEMEYTSKNVVVEVLTAANMGPLEAESLIAANIESSYIKIKSSEAHRYMNENNRIQLPDTPYSVRFSTVKSFIDTYLKNLQELFALFGAVMAVMTATVVVVVISLIYAAFSLRAKELAVTYMLGYTAIKRFIKELLLIDFSCLIGLIAGCIGQSKAAIIMSLVIVLASNLVLFIMARHNSRKALLEELSRDA